MATLSYADQARVSTAAGEEFADAFYTALNSARKQISSFYVPNSPPTDEHRFPHISYNGELTLDAGRFQERFEKEMPYTYFEPQSLNVHVLNTCIEPPEGKAKRELERNMSLAVQVSGYVRLVERREGPMRGFSDNFVLVPNKGETGGKGTGKQDEGRRYLIQSHNFRFVV